MSLTIIKPGLLDTIQDTGRYGYQKLGINPGGAMDRFSAQLANCILGKRMNDPVIEMHFPAATIEFNDATLICVTGANFTAVVNNRPIELNRPVAVNKGSVLEYKKIVSGARTYVAVYQQLQLNPWLDSYSTNLKAEVGGHNGRALLKGDMIGFEKNEVFCKFLGSKSVMLLPWYAAPMEETKTDKIEVVAGNEWSWLTEESHRIFQAGKFTITNAADRMGYRLKGESLYQQEQQQLVSSGVTFGTIQLLQNGRLIVLMADHQTTGGYPRVANIVSAHLPALAQLTPGSEIAFRVIDIKTAQQKAYRQHQYLLQVQQAARFKLKNLFI